jgi:hypothetical protein
MKNIIITVIIVCCINISNAQSKKEIIQELTIENTNLKQEISVLNNKIQVLEAENITLNKDIVALKKELYVDKVQTPQEYGKTLFDLFVSQRLTKYPELQFQLKDTIYLLAKDVNTIKEAINKTQKNTLEFYLEGINNRIDWSKAQYERFEYEIEKPNEDISTNHLRGKFYFNYLGKKYRFRNEASILENGKWRGYSFNDLVNETEELEKEKKEEQERLKEPYIPLDIEFGGVVYSYNPNEVNPKTMYGLTIPIENNTSQAIDWIKFQFRIYENKKLILSKNIIIGEYSSGFDSKLEPGEKEIVELNDIGEVFIASGVKNGNWYTDVELLEAKPKQFED